MNCCLLSIEPSCSPTDIPGQASAQQQQPTATGEAGASSPDTCTDTEEGREQQMVELADTSQGIHRHAGLQQATVSQLEESVLDMSTDQIDARSLSSISPHSTPHSGHTEVDVDHDMEEEENEVSVADLPLPADKDSLHAVAEPQVEVDSETEESDDNDTLTSRHSHRDPMAGGDSVDIGVDMSRSSSVDPTDKSVNREEGLCHSDETTEPIEI